MRGHLYCSTRCARDAGRAAVWERVSRRVTRPVPARLAVFAVALAVAAPSVLALRAVRELDRLNVPWVPAPARRPAVARIEAVRQEGGGASIEGTAPAGTAVFLFAGGQFVAATPEQGGRFRFESVRVPGPYRVGAILLSAEAAATPSPVPAETPSPVPAPSAATPPRSDQPLPAFVPDFTRGPSDRRQIVLSFDAGSSDRGAAEILGALARRGVRTTIFLTGDFIRRFPALARRIAEDGHEVGNHTDTHPHLTTYAADGRQATRPGVDRGFLAAELGRASRIYRDTTGHAMASLWRAPFGEQNAEIRRWAAEAGYWHVGWTGGRAGLDGLDWISDPRSPSYRSSEGVVEKLIERAENGGVVLLHLGSNRQDPVARKIPDLLDGLSRRGFGLALASEFLEREGLTPARLAALADPARRPAP